MIAERRAATGPLRGLAGRWRAVGIVALGVAALIGAWQLVGIFQTSPFAWHDFAQDYIAGEDVLAGRSPYRAQNERVGELFNIPPPNEGPAYSFHPPTTVPFFVPFALLPYPAAFILWDLILLACLWAIVDLAARSIDRPLSPVLGLATALGLVAVWPLRENFVEGQLNIAVTAGLVACWYAVRVGRPGWAGVALATAVALKPLAGLYVLWALWRREWWLLVAASAALGLYSAVGVWMAGIQGTIDYVTVAYPLHAGLWPGYPDNASPQGLYTRLFGPSPWRPRPPYQLPELTRLLTLGTWALAVGLLFWRMGWQRPDRARLNAEMAGLGATMLLVTPIIWPHYYVVLVAPVAVFVAALWRRRAWGWLALLAIALLVLWLPRDLHAWLARQNLAPRSFGLVQLPALLAVYAVALSVLWTRADRMREPAPASPAP